MLFKSLFICCLSINSKEIIMLTKRENEIMKKIFSSYQSWNSCEDEGSKNQALNAREKMINKLNEKGGCDHFNCWNKNDVSCKNCSGILKDICQTLTSEDLKMKAEEERKNQKNQKGKKERDEFGFIVGSNNWKVKMILSDTAMKMADIKELLGNTYYDLVKKRPEVFGVTKEKLFFVIGSEADPNNN